MRYICLYWNTYDLRMYLNADQLFLTRLHYFRIHTLSVYTRNSIVMIYIYKCSRTIPSLYLSYKNCNNTFRMPKHYHLLPYKPNIKYFPIEACRLLAIEGAGFSRFSLTPVNILKLFGRPRSLYIFHPWYPVLSLQINCHGPLSRYVKLQVSYAPGMPETFSLSPTSKETTSDPACITARASHTCRDICRDR